MITERDQCLKTHVQSVSGVYRCHEYDILKYV